MIVAVGFLNLVNSAAYELTNGTWFWINLFCLILFVCFVYDNTIQIKGWNPFTIYKMVKSREFAPEVQASVALFMYFIGATLRAGDVWYSEVFKTDPHEGVRYLAAAFAVAGGLCMLRIFTREAWGGRVWITAGVIAIAIPILALVY